MQILLKCRRDNYSPGAGVPLALPVSTPPLIFLFFFFFLGTTAGFAP
jgi:hypothetical protein